MIHSPNRWSCLPCSFAMVCDVTLQHFLDLIGHDGSEVVWPNSPEPLCRRGFHIQECLGVAQSLGYAFTPYAKEPALTNGEGIISLTGKWSKLPLHMDGVALGMGDIGINHAVAWINGQLLCPSRGVIQSFSTRELWVMNKCSR